MPECTMHNASKCQVNSIVQQVLCKSNNEFFFNIAASQNIRASKSYNFTHSYFKSIYRLKFIKFLSTLSVCICVSL